MEEDKKLYKEYLNGNEEAFNKIVNKYKTNLIYFISTYVKDLDVAEDIFQDSIIYIIENKEKYDNKYSLKAYLYLIAKSRALNYIKKNNKTIRLEDDLEEKELLEEIICSKERKEKILEAINELPEEYRRVI